MRQSTKDIIGISALLMAFVTGLYALGIQKVFSQAYNSTVLERKFNRHDLKKFMNAGGTVEYAKKLTSEGFSGKSIYRFKQLEMKVEDAIRFNDTPKPNAVIIYPTADKENAFEKPASIELYNKIKKSYDTWVRVASTEQQVYDAINYVPNIELLVLAGHGERFSLDLGENEDDEKQTIDISDKELKKYLQKLDPNAVIFLCSCSTAEGGRYSPHLANFIAKVAEGRKVIAPTQRTKHEEIHVKSAYPLDIEFIEDATGKNITYTNLYKSILQTKINILYKQKDKEIGK